ncbi:DUF2795 domain-containing protein [Phytoactinopolyspora limicola]|uniref:DUF2795 domain-containing protein n=1 Tax=Phytoactinopolyspora limicola TaxID=2715536 RepID=UPI00140BC9E9|nr:DUF2795 domain-containing protein [Phytoactinopolyspora limicola]
MNVTRIEIADLVEDAFGRRPATKAELLDRANANHARSEVLATLDRLPDVDFRTLRDLWPHLSSIPVGD